MILLKRILDAFYFWLRKPLKTDILAVLDQIAPTLLSFVFEGCKHETTVDIAADCVQELVTEINRDKPELQNLKSFVFFNIGILKNKVDSVIEEEDCELANTLTSIFSDLGQGNL